MGDFLCTECHKEFKCADDLDLHYHNTHDKTPFNCEQCEIQCIGRQQFNNHKRKHKAQKQVFKCKQCQYEVHDASNFNKHVKLHTVVKVKKGNPKPKISRTCATCGKTFDRKDSFDRHVRTHSKESDPTYPCTQCDNKFSREDSLKIHRDTVHADNIHSDIGHGLFQKRKKVKRVKTYICERCAKTFNSEANLKRHFLTSAHTTQAKKGRSRWTVMRKVRKLLKDSQYAEEIGKKWKVGAGNGGVDSTLVETIMSQIPNMSNRNLLRTLTILRKKLPKNTFKANLKKVIQERTNLCDDLFETEFSEVLDSKGESVNMPITHAKHLNTLILLVCEKRGLCEDDIKIVLGIDGGQSKLICTMAIVPKDEMDKKARMAQENVKDRSKSSSTKRCLVIALHECNHFNVQVKPPRIKKGLLCGR